MARPRIHVTAPVPAEVGEALARDFETSESPEGAEGIVSMLTTRVDGPYLDRAGPQLKVVANYAVGVNNVDLAAAAERDVVVANTPDVLTRATAELAVGLMLALLRRIVEGDRFVRRREEWRFSLEFMLGSSLDGKRLLAPKTVAYMTADHLSPAIATTPLYLPGPGFGFGLGFAVRRDAGVSPVAGTVGEYNWGGAGGTYFWVDPREDMLVVFMMQSPKQRVAYRAVLKDMIYAAITRPAAR